MIFHLFLLFSFSFSKKFSIEFLKIEETNSNEINLSGYNLTNLECIDLPKQCVINAKFIANKNFEPKIIPYLDIILKLNFLSPDDFSFQIHEKNYMTKNQYLINITKQDEFIPFENKEINYNIEIESFPLSMRLRRKYSNESIFDTKNSNFFLTNNFSSLTLEIPTNLIFGFGERFAGFLLEPDNYTIWNKDNPSESNPSSKNNYGFHPLYLLRENSKNFHLILLNNINALEIEYTQNLTLNYKLLDDNLNFRVFLGNNDPEKLIKKYHDYLGGAILHPFWSMGYFHSKYGTDSIDILEKTVNRYLDSGFPLEGIFLDIDYLLDNKPFKINERKYNPKKINKLKLFTDIKVIVIVDPVIAKPNDLNLLLEENRNQNIDCDTDPAVRGVFYDIFLKDPYEDKIYEGQQWGGVTYIPDFTHPNITQFWGEIINCLHEQIHFDGLWLDMNEISLFSTTKFKEGILKNQKKYFPFLPKSLEEFGLSEGTLNIDIQHYNNYSEKEIHNIFAYNELKITQKIAQKLFKTKFPFMLTRSNIFGIGKFAQVWSGDDYSSYSHLQLSISSIFNFNLFGLPMSGADICGFFGDSTNDLCARWMQLGSFYPFSRNHNFLNSKTQDPYSFSNNMRLGSLINMKIRYSLLRHYYSLFVRNNGRGTVYRPLFFEFSDDENCYDKFIMETQFLIGNNLIGIPILRKDSIKREGYLPKDYAWFNFYSGKNMNGKITIKNEIYEALPLFIREGTLILKQKTDDVKNTMDLSNSFSIVAALDETLNAKGSIIGITDYNENKINKFCVKKNCLVNIDINMNIVNEKFELDLKFKWEDHNSYDIIKKENEDILHIHKIKLYGIKNFELLPENNIKIFVNGVQQNYFWKIIKNMYDLTIFFYKFKVEFENTHIILQN